MVSTSTTRVLLREIALVARTAGPNQTDRQFPFLSERGTGFCMRKKERERERERERGLIKAEPPADSLHFCLCKLRFEICFVRSGTWLAKVWQRGVDSLAVLLSSVWKRHPPSRGVSWNAV